MSILVSDADLIILVVGLRPFQFKILFPNIWIFLDLWKFLVIIGDESQFGDERCHELILGFLCVLSIEPVTPLTKD